MIERIDGTGRENMAHLKAVVFVRPTAANVNAISEELRNPKYGEYSLVFSNMVPKSYLEDLAEADVHELVRSVHEYYADFFAVNPDLFSVSRQSLFSTKPSLSEHMPRLADGLTAVLLALKKKPNIRFQRSSPLAQKLAQEVNIRIEKEAGLFDFRRPDTAPLLLILDRRNDPVTPLLSQWTYQAMVHELIGLENHRVSLASAPGVRKDMEEVVMSSENDAFYKQNMFSNFGDLGMNLKEMVADFQSKTHNTQTMNSIADMKKFVESYPEFRKLSGTVSKHVTLVSELSRLIEKRALFECSELEQDLACHDEHSTAYKAVVQALHRNNLSNYDRLRLVMLYALRYENQADNYLLDLLDILSSKNVPLPDRALVGALMRYAGSAQRSDNLFGTGMGKLMKRVGKSLVGVENVYTQHVPLLQEQLDAVFKGKLKDSLYPFFVGGGSKERPLDVIVFIVGGVTYEEARAVSLYNQSNPESRIVLGGSSVLNSRQFIEEIAKTSDATTGANIWTKKA